jgi:hypothetical protein
MPIKTSCEIKCLDCGKWFRAGIQFGVYESFFTSCIRGSRQNCPYCGTMTPCNKENMRFVEDAGEGHKTYIEGKDTI